MSMNPVHPFMVSLHPLYVLTSSESRILTKSYQVQSGVADLAEKLALQAVPKISIRVVIDANGTIALASKRKGTLRVYCAQLTLADFENQLDDSLATPVLLRYLKKWLLDSNDDIRSVKHQGHLVKDAFNFAAVAVDAQIAAEWPDWTEQFWDKVLVHLWRDYEYRLNIERTK
jgi:hypothetical protein